MNAMPRMLFIVALPLALTACGHLAARYDEDRPARAVYTSQKADSGELRTAMRKLWEDHITYTRNYIISALSDLPDASSVAARLMKNQEDLGNAIVPYYGSAAGQKLTALLKEHIQIATDVVKAAKAGDKPRL